MTQTINSAILVFLGFLTLGLTASAAESEVPEPFRGFDDNSKYSISYDDLTAVLNTVVVDVGLSTRREAQEAASKRVGTTPGGNENRAGHRRLVGD